MIRSMTGYGASEVERAEGAVSVEARSVNSRHLKVHLRVPSGAEAWEPDLRARVAARVRRGNVHVQVETRVAEREGPSWELDEERVRGWLEAFEELRQEFALPGAVDLGLLVRAGGILRERDIASAEWLEEGHVREGLDRALEALVEMREREGARLEEDLRGQVSGIRARVAEVEALAPDRLRRERDRLRAAVKELTEGVELAPERLEREIALLAERWDIGEELVRARSHLDAFEEYLDASPEEPVGKRLAFLVQELHREINTMGAKANDARISRHVVEMKDGLEKLREQVENVE